MREVLDDSFGGEKRRRDALLWGWAKKGPQKPVTFARGPRGGKWPGKGGPAAILINAYSGDFCHPVLWDAVLAEPLVYHSGTETAHFGPPPRTPPKTPFFALFWPFCPPGPPRTPPQTPPPGPPPPQKSFPQRTKNHGDRKKSRAENFFPPTLRRNSPRAQILRAQFRKNVEKIKCAKHNFFLHTNLRAQILHICTKTFLGAQILHHANKKLLLKTLINNLNFL